MGISIIRALQELRTPAIDEFMHFVTYLSNPTAIILGIGLVITFRGGAAGFRITGAVLFALLANLAIKEMVQLDRPYITHPDVFMIKEKGYSFPSGHAMVGLAFWFWLGCEYVEIRIQKLTSWVIVLIGISRCYFGVHYPTDVLAGWFFGMCSLAAWAGMLGIGSFWQGVRK